MTIPSAVASTVLAIAAVVAGPGAQSSPSATCRPAVVYQPPLVAPVVDPFRSPSTPYGPGNRGIDYATTPGDVVGAVAGGTVVFVGVVAGDRYVTVLHPDGLRSSYGPLASSSVIEGASIVRGDSIGVAGDSLHLGVRCGSIYLDPARLFARRIVRLVPVPTASR